MKNFHKTNGMKKMLKPLATLFLFLVLIISVNAQVISTNGIKAPTIVSSATAFNPGVLTGTDVAVTNKGGSICPNVTYEWQSASDAAFTKNLKTNLAATKDYNPGTVTTTTFFRRIVAVECTQPERSARSIASGIKITIH